MALLNAGTNFNLSLEEVMQTGERIWNLERLFNLQAGLSAADDTLPKRLLEEPLKEGPNAGKVARLAEMLPAYYKLRGWSPDGVPTEDKLKELKLK